MSHTKDTKSTISVEESHIKEARHSEADDGRRVGTDPISRAVAEFLKMNAIKHDRPPFVYRKPGVHDLWLSINQNEEIKLPAECSYFMTMFDKRLDEKPPRPFVFQVRL